MTALHAHAVRRGDAEGAFDRVVLDYADRFLRRKRLATAAGAELFVDLPETVSLDDGDALVVEDGRLVRVTARPEPLLEVLATATELARLAWHIGNRHTPAEITDGCIRVQRDHVIEQMLQQLGAEVRHVELPFRPEGGAYGIGRTHGHHHGGATDDPDRPHDHGPHDHGPHDHGPAPQA
jgi:urease accessory protein